MSVYDINIVNKVLSMIKQTTSNNDKMEILDVYKSNPLLDRILGLTYDSKRNYYVKKLPETSEVIEMKMDFDHIEDFFVDLEKLEFKGSATKEDKLNLAKKINGVPEEYRWIFEGIINRNLKIGINEKMIYNSLNEDLKKEVNKHKAKCMLAEPQTKLNLFLSKFNKIGINVKLDGYRVLAICNLKTKEVKFVSRKNKEYTSIDYLKDKVLESIFVKDNYKQFIKNDILVLDGEVTAKTFKDLQTIMKRKSGEGSVPVDSLVFNIFDVSGMDGSLLHRVNFLNDCISENRNVKLVKYIYSFNNENISNLITECYSKALEDGYEGLVIKNMECNYENKRTIDWVKLKPKLDGDFKIIDIYEGEGEFEGMLGGVVIDIDEVIKGETCDVGSGFSLDQRQDVWNNKEKYLGTLIEVQYQELTDEALRFPVFKRFRDDK